MDLHEIIFSRGDVQGAGKNALLAIMNQRNAGFIHRACHSFGEGGMGKQRGIMYLLHWEGYSRVMSFVAEMSNHIGNVLPYSRAVVSASKSLMLGDHVGLVKHGGTSNNLNRS